MPSVVPGIAVMAQDASMAPAGSSTARLLARTPGVHVVLDSWAFPPGNTDRPSLPRYAHMVAGWYARNLTGAAQATASRPTFLRPPWV